MLRYHGDSWQNLTTILVNQIDDYTYYKSETPGFSVFAITGEQMTVQICTADEKQCSGNELQECSNDGMSWNLLETCEYGCDSGDLACNTAAVQDQICVPAEKRCSGSLLEQCDNDGSAWVSVEDCIYGCWDGGCKGPGIAGYSWLIAFLAAIGTVIVLIAHDKRII
jgi:hypothetical protein